MSRFAVLLAGILLVCRPVPAGAGVESPLQGIGEMPFSADLPVFHHADGRPWVHAAARIFERDLVRPTSGRSKRVSLHMKLAQFGRVLVDTTRTIDFVPREVRGLGENSWTEPFRLIEIQAPVESGAWAVTLEVTEDSGATSRATGVLDVPGGGMPRMSDPQFRLGEDGAGLPWPDRVYGLNQDTLAVYFEVEIPAGAGLEGARPFLFEVHDPRYGVLDDQTLQLPLEAGLNATIWTLPVGDFPEGSYGLSVRPPWSDTALPLKEFSVSWRIDRALEGGDELLVEAELALLPRDFETFQGLSRARQLEFLHEFWDRVDPTPGTERNEIRNRFRARIAEANRIYHSRRGPGALSDRGRILVRYGRPRQIDAEVMPRNGDDLELAITNLHDIYTPEVAGVMARGDIYGDPGTGPRVRPQDLPGVHENPSLDSASEIASDLRRNAQRVGREGGFEVWKYEYIGDPLLEHHRPGMSENQDIRFIFVDRQGVGEFRLEFSNLPVQR